MSGEWNELEIGDIADVIGGGTPSTKDEDNFNGNIPWITPKDLSGYPYRYISYGERNISEKGLATSSARLLPKDAILLTTRAPIGYVAIASNPLTTNQGFRSLVLREGFYPEFVYYLLKSNTDYLQAHASGTTFGELSGTTLKGLRFLFPPLIEQRAIAAILGSLDDKIELNRRMNETMEAMARAIFKSWFVDFDPVRAKMEGRQPSGMDAETAALFPDSFEDSPLGKIPKGWRVLTIGDVCEFAYGKSLKKEIRHPGSVPVYGSNGQVGWHDKTLVKGPGIVVGRKGNPGVVTWVSKDFFPIDTTFYIVLKGPILSMYYLFHALSSIDLASLGADSAVPGLNRNIAYMTKILVPSIEVVNAFDKHNSVFYEKIRENNEESQTLSDIRDALLPKLLSGEIRVKDAKKYTETKYEKK